MRHNPESTRVVGFALVMLFVVSVYPMVVFSRTANSRGASGFSATQTTVDPLDWWPMFHHDPAGSGHSTSTAPNSNQTLWNYTTSDKVWSCPAVAEGMVFVGSGNCIVYALNATTGAFLWTAGYPVNFGSNSGLAFSPIIVDGALYVSAEDHVYALNSTTGAYLWTNVVDDGVFPCAVADGKVYIGSDDRNIYAFGSSASAQSYSVSFTESGLPSGAEWWVDLGGENQSSTSNIITFFESDGTYFYSVGASDYTASPSTGSVTVDGTNSSEQVIFTIVPEFSSLIFLPLFMVATLLAARARKRRTQKKNCKFDA
jgi:outer membrane protein assembly factor BamB